MNNQLMQSKKIVIKNKILEKAHEIGFSKIGFAETEKLDDKFLSDWLTNGFHGTMGWMENKTEWRLDPSKYFEGTKTVLSLAVNYYPGDDPDRNENTGQISRYALGKDYHFIVKDMLVELLDYIVNLIPGAKGKTAVDTAPVLDKVWAAKAGVGWIGKHSNVLNREFGSYFFLGEILLTEELPPDEPYLDHCGTCTACIDLCPTQAIVEPYVVDSNKCISYRTIEFHGDFPEEWESENKDWVFGCDVCQEVCPWNKFVKVTDINDFKNNNGFRFPDVEELKDLNEENFNIKFKKSAIKRTKLSGLKRNAQNVKNYLKQKVKI